MQTAQFFVYAEAAVLAVVALSGLAYGAGRLYRGHRAHHADAHKLVHSR